jgi:hypothetical protein
MLQNISADTYIYMKCSRLKQKVYIRLNSLLTHSHTHAGARAHAHAHALTHIYTAMNNRWKNLISLSELFVEIN